MQRQKPEDRCRVSKIRRQKSKDRGLKHLLIVMVVCLLSAVLCSLAAFGSEKWQGIDQTVVGKFAAEQGREAHRPLINIDQGDLLLFVFLLAGTVGGFIAGYSWRMLVNEKSSAASKEKKVVS